MSDNTVGIEIMMIRGERISNNNTFLANAIAELLCKLFLQYLMYFYPLCGKIAMSRKNPGLTSKLVERISKRTVLQSKQ